MPGMKPCDRKKSVYVIIHEIMTRATMHMQVDKTRRYITALRVDKKTRRLSPNLRRPRSNLRSSRSNACRLRQPLHHGFYLSPFDKNGAPIDQLMRRDDPGIDYR